MNVTKEIRRKIRSGKKKKKRDEKRGKQKMAELEILRKVMESQRKGGRKKEIKDKL